MADVVQKVITANDVKNGGAIANVDKLGNIQVVYPEVLADTNLTRTENKLATRYDDVSYYTA